LNLELLFDDMIREGLVFFSDIISRSNETILWLKVLLDTKPY